MAIGAAIGAISGLAQVGFGIADRIKGKRKLKEATSFFEENKYDIPPAAKASLGVAERQAQGFRLPGEDIRRAQISQATAGGVGAAQQAATSSSDVLSVLSGLYGQQQTAEQNLAISGAERYDANQAQLQKSLGMMAGYEDVEWQQNVLAPYQQMLGQAEAFSSRGGAGIGAGISGIGATGAGMMQMQGEQGRFDEWRNYMTGGAPVTPYMQNQYDRQYLGGQRGQDPSLNVPRTVLPPIPKARN